MSGFEAKSVAIQVSDTPFQKNGMNPSYELFNMDLSITVQKKLLSHWRDSENSSDSPIALDEGIINSGSVHH